MDIFFYLIGFVILFTLFDSNWFWLFVIFAIGFVLYENDGDIDASIDYTKDKVESIFTDNPGKEEFEEKFEEKEYKPGDPL